MAYPDDFTPIPATPGSPETTPLGTWHADVHTAIVDAIDEIHAHALTVETRLDAAGAETAATIGALIAGATAKPAIVGADSFGVSDSAAGGLLKKTTLAELLEAIYKASGLRRVVFSDAKPRILCSDGTLNAGSAGSATITGITALYRACASPGGWVHIPAVGSHPGGWLRFNSATTTTITLTDAVATGGTFSQTTGAHIEVPLFTLPGGVLGPNGGLTFTYQFNMSNSATQKIPRIYLGATNIGPGITLTTAATYKGILDTANRGSEALQATGLAGTPVVVGSSTVPAASVTVSTVDTTTPTDISVTLYLSAASADWVSIESIRVEAFYGA
jgi:hypothetical protein